MLVRRLFSRQWAKMATTKINDCPNWHHKAVVNYLRAVLRMHIHVCTCSTSVTYKVMKVLVLNGLLLLTKGPTSTPNVKTALGNVKHCYHNGHILAHGTSYTSIILTPPFHKTKQNKTGNRWGFVWRLDFTNVHYKQPFISPPLITCDL